MRGLSVALSLVLFGVTSIAAQTTTGAAGSGSDTIAAQPRTDLPSIMVVPFGQSEPVLTCAPLRACVVELEAGETVVDAPIAGDPVRWIIQPAKAGADGSTQLVVVKPTDCDLSTNLVLTTSRRIYHVALESPPCKGRGTNPRHSYTRHLKFSYPADAGRQWIQQTSTAGGLSVESLRFNYRVKRGKKAPWVPAAVFDDGVRVFIKLPPEAKHAELPVLFNVEDDGSRTLLNYTVVEDTYVTDRLLSRGELVTGTGKRERRITIERVEVNGAGTAQ